MSRRGAVAALIVVLWIAGMAMMVSRNRSRTDAQRLADVALRVQPATYYYVIERDGTQIGAASSTLDTTANSLLSQEYFVGSDPTSADNSPARISARSLTKLTRGLHLLDVTADVTRPRNPLSIRATIQDDTAIFVAGKHANRHPPARYTFKAPLFTPTISSIVFMLSGKPEIGRAQTVSLFDPTTRTVLSPTLRIRAESVFTVVDSAATDQTGSWVVAHRDTVRAWRIEGAPHGLTAWVDVDGRIVAANAGSLSATRTAFELAFKQSKPK